MNPKPLFALCCLLATAWTSPSPGFALGTLEREPAFRGAVRTLSTPACYKSTYNTAGKAAGTDCTCTSCGDGDGIVGGTSPAFDGNDVAGWCPSSGCAEDAGSILRSTGW